MERCENCRFWLFAENDEDGDRVGYCRRHPPVRITDGMKRDIWATPLVTQNWVCGEFEKDV